MFGTAAFNVGSFQGYWRDEMERAVTTPPFVNRHVDETYGRSGKPAPPGQAGSGCVGVVGGETHPGVVGIQCDVQGGVEGVGELGEQRECGYRVGSLDT